MRRSHTKFLFKDFRKVKLRFEAQVKGDIFYALICSTYHIAGLLKPELKMVLRRRQASIDLKHPPEIGITHMVFFCKSLKINGLIKVFPNFKLSCFNEFFNFLAGKSMILYSCKYFS